VLRFGRGQTLLETLIVVAAVLIAVGMVTAALRALTANERPQIPRLIALDATENAATELLAATAFDSNALDHIAPAQWQAGATALALVAKRSGQAQSIVLHYKGRAVEGDLPLSLRSVAPPPDAVIDPAAPATAR